MIKAILFDMDGVLIDAREWHYEALNRALNSFGFSISREAHLSTFDGLPTREKLKLLSKSKNLPEGLHNFINEIKQRNTLSIIHTKCKPTFNHQQALSMLKARGYAIGVCSNSIRRSVETMMQLSRLDKYLDVMFSNEDVNNGKPDPEMYMQAMKILGVLPKETLILEDNDHGIEAAIASGGHLLKIGEPSEVTFELVTKRIAEIEGEI